MTSLSVTAPSSLEFSEQDFARVSQIAKQRFGLKLEPSKKSMIRSRLLKRVTAMGLDSFAQYCSLVDRDTEGECDNFISALTTNVTHFYREKHHFDMFEGKIMPDLASRLKAGGRVRIWSAGCSSGQEPYSLAGSVFSCLPDAARYDLRILATDVDQVILGKAQAGVYPVSDCRFPSEAHKRRVFKATERNADMLSVKKEIKSLVTFRRLNLHADWPFSGKFDLILCRNVAIYFDRETQAKLWSRMAVELSSDGHIFIGHSERVQGPALDEIESVGITAYRRKSKNDPHEKEQRPCL